MSDSDSTYQAFMEGFKGTIQPISLEAGDLKKTCDTNHKVKTQIMRSKILAIFEIWKIQQLDTNKGLGSLHPQE